MHKELQILKDSTNIKMASLLHNRHRWYDLHFVHNENLIYCGHYVTLILRFSGFLFSIFKPAIRCKRLQRTQHDSRC